MSGRGRGSGGGGGGGWLRILGSNLCLRRCLASKCRPSVLIAALTLAVGLWLFCHATAFYYKQGYGEDVFSVSKTNVVVMEKSQKDGLLSEDTQKEEKKEEEKKKEEEEEKEEEFRRRRTLYEKTCGGHVNGRGGDIYYHEPSRLALCHVPKAGCSFWKRIFHFLNNETNGRGVASPFQIDRYYVHFGTNKKTNAVPYAGNKKILDGFTKRRRKRAKTANITEKIGRSTANETAKIGQINKAVTAATKSITCPRDVSFQEFLDYALNGVEDSHWQPVHVLCNPCQFGPRYVGKVETFSADSFHILREVGLKRLIEGHESHNSHTEDEVRMLTKYHYQIYARRRGIRRCLNHTGVARRLWMAFVLNGYIAGNLTFPAQQFSAAVESTLNSTAAGERATRLFLKYHRLSPLPTSQETSLHRRRVMVREYRKVPRVLLDKFAKTFKDDFALFGYQARPEDIFTS
ncbi:hypothetical protein ACOMHN_017222 [Nucella lapillus]